MKLVERLQQATKKLTELGIEHALAGGLVASLYRRQPRATADIDIVVLTEEETRATQVLQALGLRPFPLRKADLEGGPAFAIKRKSTPVFLVCGRGRDQSDPIGVDLILANMPWAKSALERAQSNRIDFGLGQTPCITAEDLILAKIYSVGNQATRFMDLDDLRSILESGRELDWTYINDQIKTLGLRFPKALIPFAPKLT